MKPRFSRFATAGLAALTAAATLAMVGGTAAHAAGTTPPYEPPTTANANEVGTLSFLDSTGAEVVSGSTTAAPFATYAVGSAAPSATDTKAALYACLPQVNVDPSLWSCSQLSALTTYPVTTAGAPTAVTGTTKPVVTQTAGDETLAQFAASFPNTDTSTTDGYAGLYQLRLRTSTGSNPPSTTYDAGDVKINTTTNTFQVVFPTPPAAAQTTTTLTASPNGTSVGGTSVALSAAVSPNIPGTVTFAANGVTIGSSAVDTTSGVTTLATTALPVGTDAVTASFVPTDTTDYSGSTGTLSYSVTPTAAGAGSFVSVTPTRILDTRNAIGVPTKTPVAKDGTVKLQVTSVDGIPSTATAVVLNVTATNEASSGYVQVYPGPTKPTVSAVNYVKGVTQANAVIVPLASDGTVQLYTTAQTDLLADVSGYIAGGSGSTEVGGFAGVTPTRILDTRHGLGVTTSTPVPADGSVTLHVTGAITGGGTSPVPAGAAAVVMNVTALDEQKAGFVQVYPGTTKPTVSSINYSAKQTLANAVVVPLNADGTVTLYTTAPADLLADVSGYIVGSTTAIPTAAGAFVSVTPSRLLDTRHAIGVTTTAPVTADGTVTLQVSGRATIPGGAAGVVLNVTALNELKSGFVKVYPGTTQPTVSTVNYNKGETLANAAVASLTSSGTVTLYTTSQADLLADVSEYIVG